MTDFFGMTREEMNARKISFIGWGFSYQANDPRTKSQVCDFEFQSGTFNRGDLFTNALSNVQHIQSRGLQDKMGDYLRANFNYMRAYNIRTLKDLTPVNEFFKEQGHWFYNVPGCQQFAPWQWVSSPPPPPPGWDQ